MSTIQLRRGTSTEWASSNPVLAAGEIGFVTDTMSYKIGDGVSSWNSIVSSGASTTISGLNFLVSSESPTTPPDGQLVLYARSVAGRVLPAFKGPSGLDTTLQPSLAGNGFYLVVPGTGTAMNVLGGPAITVVGTLSHPALVTSTLLQQTSRASIVSAAGANSAAEIRAAFARSWRGNAAGLGGFLFRCRFAITSTVANSRCYIGLTDSTGATSTTQVPSDLLNLIAVGYDSADANFQIMHNDGSGSATKIDLGSSFARNSNTSLYEISFFAAPNDSVINYLLTNLSTGAQASGSLSTNIPGNTTFLAPHAYINNGGTASAVTLQIARLYIESDY